MRKEEEEEEEKWKFWSNVTFKYYIAKHHVGLKKETKKW